MQRENRITEVGHNCWRRESASRLSFLVDAAAYYDAVAQAIEKAQRSVVIIGWDIHTKTPLRHDAGGVLELEQLLMRVLNRNPRLDVYLLEWDFSVLFAFERDWTLVLGRGAWAAHPRLHFEFDDRHPWGASQHQKLVVIDDAVAFAGGIDLTINRWDTREHREAEERRVLPDGSPYTPFHDVQLAVDGAAARALAELARWRWHQLTDQRIDTSDESDADRWPEGLNVDIRDVEVGIARTIPQRGSAPAIKEVLQLNLDAIAAARESIYVENQYFTSPAIADALEQRLSEPSGPEVVLVLPRDNPGWLEQNTMGALRRRYLAQLRRADEHGRLRAVAPVVGALGSPTCINVHAKVLIIDDRLVRVGSSNFSRRSMGFDSECDLVVEAWASDDERTRLAIRRFRDGLVAEHLGLDLAEVERRLSDNSSLLALVDASSGDGKRLLPLNMDDGLAGTFVDPALADPDNPEAPSRAVHHFLNGDVPEASRHPWIKATLFLAVLAALAASWRWTPLSEWVQPDKISVVVSGFRDHALAPVFMLGIYTIGSVVMLPLTALILVTALTFEPWLAIAYSLLGSILGGLAGFVGGRVMGRGTVRRIAGSRIHEVSRKLAQRGVMSVVAIRLVPVMPFTIANLVIGASHVRWRDFVIGTALGLLPGILAVNLFETTLTDAVANPSWRTIALAVAIPALTIVVLAVLRRTLRNVTGEG